MLHTKIPPNILKKKSDTNICFSAYCKIATKKAGCLGRVKAL